MASLSIRFSEFFHGSAPPCPTAAAEIESIPQHLVHFQDPVGFTVSQLILHLTYPSGQTGT